MSRPSDGTVYRFDPRNRSQKEAVRLYETCRVLFLLGPPGVGKSQVAVALAVGDVVARRRKAVVLSRPVVECRGAGKGLGFLKGELADKMAPYVKPLQALADKVAFRLPRDVLQVEPLEFLRGTTFEDVVAILDEGQNADLSQLRLFLSRLGKNSRLIINGDSSQTDIRPTVAGYDTDLEYVADVLDGLPGVGIVDFNEADQVRDPLVSLMMKRLGPGSR